MRKLLGGFTVPTKKEMEHFAKFAAILQSDKPEEEKQQETIKFLRDQGYELPPELAALEKK